jgi:rfaE bifunctional protein kinase chain/domain
MSLSIPDFSGLKVLVVGDLMLDQYWFGPTSRISPEAPVPVVQVRRSETRPGGAANVAINLVSLGVQATVSGLIGADEGGKELTSLL